MTGRAVNRQETNGPSELEALRTEYATLTSAYHEILAQSDQLRALTDELREAEAVAWAQRRRFKDLFEAIPDAYLVTDAAGTLREANPAAQELTGLERQFMVGKPVFVLVPVGERRSLRRQVAEVVQSGRDALFTTSFQRRRGGLVPVEARIATRLEPTREPARVQLHWIVRDVGQRTAIDRLRRQRDELEILHRAKNELLSLLSHELRTPLTAIYGEVDILYRRLHELDEGQQRELLYDIRLEARRLQEMIENMLILGRPDEEVPLEAIPIEELITSAAERHERAGGRPARTAVPAGLPDGAGLRIYSEQILANLLSNAEKYSGAGASIEISAACDGMNVRITVLDRGNGLNETDRPHVFDAFFRGSGGSPVTPGAGLGLTVCARLAERQGGSVWLTPRPEGGTEAGFSLPVWSAGQAT